MGGRGVGLKSLSFAQGFLGSSQFGTVISRVRGLPCRGIKGGPSFLSLEVGRPFASKTPSNYIFIHIFVCEQTITIAYINNKETHRKT